MEHDNILERVSKLETLVDVKLANVTEKVNDLTEAYDVLELKVFSQLNKYKEEDRASLAILIKSVQTIEAQTAQYKSIVGAVIFTLTSIIFTINQISTWFNFDLTKVFSIK